MKRFLLMSFILTIALLGFSQRNVIQLPLDSNYIPASSNFIYFLPKTAFKVIVTVEKNEQLKGYYSDFADKMLGISYVFSENKTSYLISNIDVQSFNIPDSNFQFLVEMSPKQIKSDFYIQILNQNFKPIESKSYVYKEPTQMSDFFKNYSDQKLLEKEESYVETRIIDGVLTQVPVSKTKTITKSLEQQAQEAADFITKIRKDRYNVITANHEVSFSKEALQYMIEELNQLEKNYLELFTGTSVKQTYSYEFIIIPENAQDLDIPVFAFNEKQGLKTLGQLPQEDIYYIKMKPQLNLSLYNQQQCMLESNKNFKKQTGYQYRLPINSELELIHQNRSIHQFGVYSVFQFSNIFVLPKNTDQFKISNYAIIF